MSNASVMDVNSTFVPLDFTICSNGVHVGMVLGYVSMSVCFFLGTPAHSWVFWLSLRAGWKSKPTQVFLLNRILIELIFCIQCAFQMLNVLIFNNRKLFSVSFIVFGLNWVSRPLMQICISVEQYLAVLHPVIFLKYKAFQYRVVFTAVVWLMAAGYAVFQAFANHFPDPIFASVFFISVIIISFCCVSVLHALKQPGPGDSQIPKERGRDVGNQQKRKAFNTIFSGLLIILFTYLPQVLMSLFDVIKIDKELLYCNIVPLVNCFLVGVLITPLLKFYKYCRKKFLKQQTEVKES